MTGPEQHAATVRDGERIAAELYAAAEKGGVTWSQLACEQMSRTVRRLVALAGRADMNENLLAGMTTVSEGWKRDTEAAVARADELERERDALLEAAQISDKLELGWHKPYLQEMEKRQAAEARADELQREREEREQFEDDVQAEAQETGQLALALDRLKLMGLANMVSPLERERDMYREWVRRIWDGAEQERWEESNGPDSWARDLKKSYREQARREADQLRAALVGAQFCLVVEYNRYRDSTPTDPVEIVGREEGMEILGETLNEIAALVGPYYAGKVAALAGVQADKPYCTCPEGADGNPCVVCGKPEAVQADNKDSA